MEVVQEGGVGEGRSESVQQRGLARGDEVPVPRLDRCLCDRFMCEGRADEELWEVEWWGPCRVAGKEVRQVVPPLVLGPP